MPMFGRIRLLFWWSLFFFSLASISPVSAEEIRDYYAEPGLNPFKDAVNQHFNEHVDPFSGTLQLKYVDLSVPGNGGMNINVTRVYTSLQTNQYPKLGLNGLGWVMHFGRIVIPRQYQSTLCNQGAFPFTTRENPSLELPDGGRELLVLDQNYQDGTLITRGNWRARCGPNGIGLVVTSPDGTRYTMNQFDVLHQEPSWLTTRIEDVHGNWIRIQYKTNAVGISYIDAIFRSEEGDTTPVVRYEYDDESTPGIRLRAVTANGQRVGYVYESIPGFMFDNYYQLVEVVRPDNRSWHYQYNPKLSDPDPDDDVLEDGLASFSLIHVTYPHGAGIDYTYQHVSFDPGDVLQKTTAIHTKTVTGSAVTGGQWTYTFAPFSFPYDDGRGGQLRHDVTTVTGPDDIQKFYHYGKDYRPNGTTLVYVKPSFVGLKAMHEIYSTNGALLQRSGWSWTGRRISTEDYWHGSGYRSWWTDDGTYAPVLTAEYTDRDSRASTAGYHHYKQYFDHDVYGNPGRVVESSNLTSRPSLQTEITYFNDPVKWIIGLPEDETYKELGGASPHTVGAIERTFDANGKLRRKVELGVETEYTYTSEGDVATVEDARNNIRRYSNYKRGIPRLERLPESVTIERDVNDAGTVASETNGRGFTTSLQYDDLNRLTAINFPIKADVSIDYDSVGGGYRRSLTRGNFRQTEFFNDFGQLLRIERRDSVTGQEIYSTQRYDASGRKTFSSYPNATIGVTSEHDALGRVLRTQHPDGTGIDYEYDDDQAKVTNERGFATSYRYLVRGVDFNNMTVAVIAAPENVGTLIYRNSFDKTTRLWQGETLANGNVRGYGKDYEYDDHQFLVRSIEPEVGTTVFTHDEVGNVLSERVNDNEPVAFEYDNLNRRRRTDFSGSTPDVVTIYDANSNVTEVTKGAAHWVYGYDENDNPITETLSITDALLGVRTYAVTNAYNNLDALSQITYPSGLVVDYAPDAFGRATRAGTFATNVTYHPSGQLHSYQLANGIVTNVTLNQRLLPETIRAGSLVDLSYTYDGVGNVDSIIDGVDATKSVRMQTSGAYDGLDRLKFAAGPWGGAQFSYDFWGNMRTKVVGSDRLNHEIDDQWRLRQVRKMDPSDTTRELARTRMEFDSRGNAVAKRRYAFDANRRVVELDDKQFIYDADSNLVQAKVVLRTPSQSTSVVDKYYLYDGNGQRALEKKHRTYDLRYSVHSHTGGLMFEESIADCTRTDYIQLGAMTLARSDDQFANPAVDTDSDGINDCMEQQLGLNANDASDAAADRDGDGLSNLQELRGGTSLAAVDTDGDGVSDFQETNRYLTDPTLADSDGDGLNDGVEAGNPQVDPALADRDHDGVSDFWELQLGSNPQDPSDGRADADGDGFSNRQESLARFDPTRAVSTPSRGRQAWSAEVLGRILGSAAIGPDGTIYVSADYENLYAIYPDGTQRWRYTVPASALSAPVVAPNGTIYVTAAGVTDGIHAINPDGTQRWVYTANNATAPVLGTDGRVYFGAYNIVASPSGIDLIGRWGALNDSGASVAGAVLNDAVTHAPAVAANGNVYLMDASGTMRAFSPTGQQLWSIPIGDLDESGAAPVIGANQTIYFSDDFGRTYAVSPEGQILWTRQSPDQQTFSTMTVGVDGTLYIGAWDSKLYAVNPLDGSDLWSVDTYGTSYTPAVAADGTVYVAQWGGAISAYSPSGSLLWMHKVETEVSSPPVIDRDGTVYFGSRTGQLFAVVDNGGGLARTPWPMSRHDSAGSSYQCFDNEVFSITADRDGDGINDCAELAYGLDPANPADGAQDADGDGLTNAQEHAAGTDLNVADSDGDGLSDGQEVFTYGTDPLNADSDGDFISDGQEVQYGLDPLNGADALADADGDGFSNRQEFWAGTDLTNAGSVPASGSVALQINDSSMPMRSVALANDGTIYQNSSTGLEALNPDFSVKWTWPTPIIGHPVIGADGTVYVITARASNTQRLVALFPNGTQRWSYSVAAPSTSVGLYEPPVLAADGTLYLGVRSSDSAGDLILAINSKGRPVWGNGVRFSGRRPKLAIGLNGDVIAHDGASGIRAYDSVSGTQRWVDTTSVGTGTEFSAPAIDTDGTIYMSNSAGLHAIAPVSGVRQWTFAGARGEPVITPDGLILQLCGTQRSLCAVSRQGALTWTAAETYTFSGSPMVASNGSVYVATRNNAFVSYSGAGARLSEATLNGSGDATYPVILIDGTIYLGAVGQRVLIVSGASGLADSPWPTKNRDNRNSRNTVRIVPVPPNPAPSVVITAPGSGAAVNLDVAEPLAMSAYAVDMTDGELSANVEWSSSLEGSLGTGASLSLTTLRVGTHTITAKATDSSNLSGTDTFTATVGIVPPTISITSPTTGAQFERGAAITLTATAHDRVDGNLSGAIEWSSSLDGPLGTAATLTVTTLQAGQHTITARVTDSSGTQATASVQITVEIVPPNLHIYSPIADRTYEQGTPVLFDAEAYDNVDGDLSSGIQWTSNRDGAIGTGATVSSSTLSLGAHVITARVRDSSGAEASQTRNITIGLVPPELFISSPSGYVEVMEGEQVNFAASANDGRDGDLSANIQWISPLDGPLHTGASFSTSSLSVGWHLVSASVTDSSGLTTRKTVWAIVNSPNGNEAPFVVIEAPRTNTEIFFTDPLTFAAVGFDNQDGEVSANVQWSSSLQGALGAGATITVSNLQVGDHIIKALVTDSGGAKGAEEIAVRVLPVPPNYPPVVTITSLGLNAFYTVDSTIPLVGTVTDRENGDLSASIIWSSDIDGELGRGAAIRVSNLTAGAHVITATATDSAGITRQATKAITINADGQAYHMYDTFDISTGPDALAGWRVVDNVPVTRPSRWRSNGGAAMELNSGYSSALNSTTIDKLGTYLLQTSGTHWTDYRVNVRLSSSWVNSFGLMFRVRDDNNYYRFSMDRNGSFRRLVKRVNGVFTTIWQDTTQYVQNQAYQLEVTVQGTTITISIDGVQLYSGNDNSHLRGSIGLYSWANGGSSFDNVEVENLTTANSNHAPLVTITSPANNASVIQGRIVTFTGTSEDPEDGTLSNTISWSSNIDGELGVGSTLNVSTLSLGTHTITARSTDSDNLTSTSTINLTVNQFVNHAPVVTIISPANGTSYGTGELIAFSASAMDEEDGNLTSSITWTSSINGALGSTGQISTSTLSAGTHTITARVTDSMGLSHAPTITVTIGAARPILLARDFNDRSLGNVGIFTDAGTTGGPPVWSASTQAAAQTSQIVGNDTSPTGIARLGTYMFYTAGTNWTNYTVEADLRSSDPDTLGIMFRYFDNTNYYRFSMDRTLSQRRLVKRVNGTFTVLKEDTVAYNLNQTYRVSISAHNGAITVMIDGQVFYTGTDLGVARGSVAFYCWRNGGATFDNLVVRSLTSTASAMAPDAPMEDEVGDMNMPSAEAAEQVDTPQAHLIDMPPLIFGPPAELRNLTAFLMDVEASAGGSAP